MDVEVLLCRDMSLRGEKILSAMVDAAADEGIRCHVSSIWSRKAKVLMTYGLGHRVRRHWTEEHRKRGGHVIGWDFGYWHRDVKHDFKMRVTLDNAHPWRLIEPMDGERFAESGIKLRNDYDPNGRVVVVGIGRKQRNWKGLGHQEWELLQLNALKHEFPGRQVVYRPKKPEFIRGFKIADGPIEDVLKNASLVVTQHSNVAIDACIAGIPVRCDDGAAYALYMHGENPTAEQRLGLLQSVAWWQYSCNEASIAWKFLLKKLD